MERSEFMNIREIKKKLKEDLSHVRYDHSIRVAKEAKRLAKHYNIDKKKAYLTGLIHDIANEVTEEQNNYWIKKGNLSSDLQQEEYKNIKHADIGAIIAKEEYNLEDDICNAIKYHTIGNKDMDMLAKIIYIADKIGRKKIPEALKPIKKLAYQDIDEALLYCLEKQETKLKDKGINLHKDTKKKKKKLQNTKL